MCFIDFDCPEYIAPFHTIFPLISIIDIDKQKKKFPLCMIVKNLREERFIQINLFFLLFRENFLLRKGVIVMHLIF